MSKRKPEFIKIFIWNAIDYHTRNNELKVLIEKLRADVLFITEPCFVPNINNYDRIWKPGGDTAIFVKRNMDQQTITLPHLTNLEATGIAMHFADGSTLHLYSVYNSHKKTLQIKDLEKLMDVNKSVVIAGNLNCKHPAWNSRVSNSKGRRLLKFMNCTNSLVIGPASPTYHNPVLGPDVVDIAILKDVSLEYSIEVADELDSDHIPVILRIGSTKNDLPPEIYELIKEKRNAKKVYRRTLCPGDKIILRRLSQQLRDALKEYRATDSNSDL